MRSASPCLGFVPAGLFVAACSSSSAPTGPIGPVFNIDAGRDVATDHLPDVHIPPLVDAHGDRTTSSDTGAHDAASHHDARDGSHPPDVGADGTADTGTADGHAGDTGPHVDAPEHADAGHDGGDAGHDAGHDAGSCPGGGTIALLGGTTTLAFAAVNAGSGWTTTMFSGQSVNATPALIPLGAGFLAAYTSATNGVIESSAYGAGAWSTPAAIPAVMGMTAGATELGSPSLAALGANVELVYQGTGGSDDFYHGVYSGGAWGAASDKVGGTISTDYGPSPPTAAASGSTLFVAFDGGNNGLYVDTWTVAGGWAGAQAISGAGVLAVPPTMIALDGGSNDLMLVFEAKTPTNGLSSVVHTSGTGAGTWSAPVVVNANALTPTQVSLAALPNGGAVMVYEGANKLPYASIYAPSATPQWTAPVEIVASSPTLSSIPTVAPGVCGAEAVASLVISTGVEIVPLNAGTWGGATLLGNLAGMQYATIATAAGN